MKSLIITAFAALTVTVASAPTDAHACSCLPPSVSASYQNASGVWIANIIWTFDTGNERFFVAGVSQTFKGCPPKSGAIVLVTPSSSATCGAFYNVGDDYLIHGFATDDPNVFAVNSCSYDRPVSQLTTADKDFLSTRYTCCGDVCACTDGTDPVSCLVDPCEVAPDCPDGDCVANYCGGCHAEHYDAYGQAVCQSCDSDADCGFGQFCNPDGVCRVSCYSDAQCGDDSWCRPVGPTWWEDSASADALSPSPGPSQCVPYAEEGDLCGGFVPPWALELCGKGLSCDTPQTCPPIADAPGICRVPCEKNSDCDASQYCATDGMCHEDGTCENNVDCNVAGNSYIHPACVGHGVCNSGTCGWTCGSQHCIDLSCVDFGPCRLVLGWGLVDGRCRLISGCTTYGLQLFGSEAKCKEGCSGGVISSQPATRFDARRALPR